MRAVLCGPTDTLRDSLHLVLKGFAGPRDIVITEDHDALQALADPHEYDLLVITACCAIDSWLARLGALKHRFARSRIVFVLASPVHEVVLRALREGASGVFPRNGNLELFITGIRLALAGGVFLPPIADNDSAYANGATGMESEADAGPHIALSPRQREVMGLAFQGKTNKQIARHLDISEHTVKAHLTTVFRACGASNRSEALYYAARHRLL